VRRTQIQIDEATHAVLRRLAYEQGTSMASIIRDTLNKSLGNRTGRHPRNLREFPFVGAGRSNQKKVAPVSERHDEALVEALRKKTER
jgi:hypothetical protein